MKRVDVGDVFGSGYAENYDPVYAEKDYEVECDLIEEAFQRFASGRVRTVLDLGCGTGGHSILLAQRGYHVIGVDISRAMLEIAREKARQGGVNIEFHDGDVRSFDAGDRVDAALLMFAVLGYQRGNGDVSSTLANVRRHIRPGGILVFDVWYGPAVLTTLPSDRERVVHTPRGPLMRSATSELDVRHHICTVRYVLRETMAGATGRPIEESHVMRYFFPLELDHYLECARFQLLSLTPTGALEGEPTADTWNVLGIARAE